MNYLCYMDWNRQAEYIVPYEGDAADLDLSEMEMPASPLYTALCDLMGLDLHETMMKIAGSEHPEEIARAYSFLLTDTEFLDAYQQLDNGEEEAGGRNLYDLRELFTWLHYLKAWFEGMESDERLRDAELFRSYAEIMLGTPVPVLHLMENNPTDIRLNLNPLKPDYRCITDSFFRAMDAGSGEDMFLAGSFRDFLVMELYQLLKGGETVLTCKNCGKRFVAFNRSDTLYCDRRAPQDTSKTCKEYGSYFARLEKVRHDEATHIYKQLYNRLQNRYRRTKTQESPEGNSRLREETEQFLISSKEWKRRIKIGEATEQEFIGWLNQRKEEMGNG